MTLSMHSHSGQYCRHAKGTLEQVIQSAISKGFTVYGLSEHMPRYRLIDLYPDEQGMTPDELSNQFESFVKEAFHLQIKYKSQIRLIVGMETEFIHDKSLQEAKDLIIQYNLKYCIGSIHHLNEIPIDYDETTFERLEKSIEKNQIGGTELCFQLYFEKQYIMIETLKPGHFDLIRMYRPNHPLTPESLFWINKSIECIKENDLLVEINSRAFKKKLKTPYPFPDLIEIMIEKQVKFTLSDDSHGPLDVGMCYTELRDYLIKNGIEQVYYPDLIDGKKSNVPLDLKSIKSIDLIS